MFFWDGYMDGSVHARDFKTMNACTTFAPELARDYAARGHPATFACTKELRVKVLPKPETHVAKTLPAG